VLELLQDGVGVAGVEGVADEQQQREPVREGDAGRGNRVEGTGADRRGHGHHLAPPGRLGEADGGQRHRRLVLAANGADAVAVPFERLAQAQRVAVAEDGEDARHQGDDITRSLVEDLLGDEEANDRLGRGQPHRRHPSLPRRQSPA
jgi:hypothetical protein